MQAEIIQRTTHCQHHIRPIMQASQEDTNRPHYYHLIQFNLIQFSSIQINSFFKLSNKKNKTSARKVLLHKFMHLYSYTCLPFKKLYFGL